MEQSPHGTEPGNLRSLAAGARERLQRAQLRAEEVFGNDIAGGVWLSRLNPAILAGRAPPLDAATGSPEGLSQVLAELDRLDPITEKLPLPRAVVISRRRAGLS
jgi:hypothetical protein